MLLQPLGDQRETKWTKITKRSGNLEHISMTQRQKLPFWVSLLKQATIGIFSDLMPILRG